MVIQLASEETLHERSRSVVTATLPAPPSAFTAGFDVASETRHFTGDGPVETLADVQALAASPMTMR